MEAVHVKFFLEEGAILPTRAHETDACWDVYSNDAGLILPKRRAVVGTGLKVGLLPGWELLIRPRSGLAAKQGVTVLNTPGTIDAGYRGEIGVILFNSSNDIFYFNPGDRVAQMALKPVYTVELLIAKSEEELGYTERGEGGFGSTD